MSSDNESVGDRIRRERKKKGFSQKKLAALSGIAQNSIGNYERGDRSPTMAVVKKIATALEVDLSELVEFTLSNDVYANTKKESYELSNKIKIRLNLVRSIALQRKITDLLVQIKELLSQSSIDGEKVGKLIEEKDALEKELHDLNIKLIKEPDYQSDDLNFDIDYHLISIYTGMGCFAETLESLFNNNEINPFYEESKIFDEVIERLALIGFDHFQILFKNDDEISYWMSAFSVIGSIKKYLDDPSNSAATTNELIKSITNFYSMEGIGIPSETIKDKFSKLLL